MGTFYRKKREYITMGALSTGRVGHFLYWGDTSNSKRRAISTLGALSVLEEEGTFNTRGTFYIKKRALPTLDGIFLQDHEGAVYIQKKRMMFAVVYSVLLNYL